VAASRIIEPIDVLKDAISASLRVSHVPRQIISALMVLKKVSTAALSQRLPLPLMHCPAAHVYRRERGYLEAMLAQYLLMVV
jgi:hypothetical protein